MRPKMVSYSLFALLLGLSLIPLILFSSKLMNSKGWFSLYLFGMGAIHLSCLFIALFKNKSKSNNFLYFLTPIITLTNILHSILIVLLMFVLADYIAGILFQLRCALAVSIGLIFLSVIVFREEKILVENEEREQENIH